MLNLKTIRRARGLSQAALAKAVGVNGREYIYALEVGRHVPSVLLAQRIAKALDVSIEDLLGEPFEPKSVGGTCNGPSPAPSRRQRV